METETLKSLKDKSLSQKIPFKNLCIAYAKDRILNAIAESDYRENLWVKRAYRLGQEVSGHYGEMELYFVYVSPDSPMTDECIGQMMTDAFAADGDDIKLLAVKQEKEHVEAAVGIKIEQVKVGIKVYVRPAIVAQQRREAEGGSPAYIVYGPEAELAEAFMSCRKYLDLAQDMGIYEDIYQILIKSPIDGRLTGNILERLYQNEGIDIAKENLEAICKLRNSPAMEKKWRAHLRGEKIFLTDWDDVMSIFNSFYQPLMEIVMRGEIFFGDWMPEIGRFL